jgi:Type II secretion system (T2SS), protein N
MMRWLLLGLVGFLAILAVRLPAAWFGGQLPAQLHCEGLGGTVWHGDCEGLSIEQGIPNRPPLRIDALQWTLRPTALLRGRVSADIELLRGDSTARATVTRGRGGLLDVRSLHGDLRIDRALLPPLPAGWQGVVTFENVTLQLDASSITQLAGAAVLQDMTDGAAGRLGSYRIEFGSLGQAAPFKGTLRSIEGPLDLQGQLTVQSDTSWVLEGTVQARSEAPPSLARMLRVLGPADAIGARPFSIAGER